MCFFNARSLLNKLDELEIFVNNFSPDLVCIVETWLDINIHDSSLVISDYAFHRIDRGTNKQGGGIACYVRCSFHSEVLFSKSCFDEVEILILRISYQCFRIILVILYFPHGRSLRNDVIITLMDYIVSLVDDLLLKYSGYLVYITGDFNHVDSSYLQSAFSIVNVVEEPTRSKNILDLILIPEGYLELYKKPRIFSPMGKSDHNVLLMEPNRPILYERNIIKVYDYRDSFLCRAGKFLHLNWNEEFKDLSLNESCELFYSYLRGALNNLPYNIVVRKPNDKPWITNVIKATINKRYEAYRQRNWSLYHHYRDKVHKMIFAAKKSWSQRYLQKHSIWDIKKCIDGSSTNKTWLMQCATNKNLIDLLNEINNDLCSNFVNDPAADVVLPFVIPFEFKQEEVYNLLIKVRCDTSQGSDGIPSFAWSKFSSLIAEPLTIIYNKCLSIADLPSLWKIADIVLFPKSNPPKLSSIRPISLLPIPERIFEKEIMGRFGCQLSSKFDKDQYGYRKTSSTVCALLNIEDFVTRNLQQQNVKACHALSVDLTKGFDKLSHNILLQKMLRDNLNPYLIVFINNYLKSRFQRVRWNHVTSDSLPVLSGVPQGSSIGPYIFGYFTADLSLNGSPHLSLTKYADDIFLVGVIDKASVNSPVQIGYQKLLEWTKNNKMEIKKEKCSQMFIRQSATYDVSRMEISGIPTSLDIKFLGVTIDQHFKWCAHISKIATRASSKLSVLRQLKPFVPSDELINVYNNCIRSVLEYGAPLFVNLMVRERVLLEKVQSRAHHIICGSSSVCECSSFIPLDYRRCMIGMKLFKRLVNDPLHPLHHLRPELNRNSQTFRVPIINTTIRERSFTVTMIRLANNGIL